MGGRRYEILGIVGRGSAGTVYYARMQGEGGFFKDVALKVLHPVGQRDGTDLAQRLRDEARVLGLVSHRSIVGADALVQLNGRWTVVMEYVPGANLFDLTRDPSVHAADPDEVPRQALPPRVAVEILGAMAGALDVAYHTRGSDAQPLRLLHRDLKPSNLRITRNGEVKILDFGFAKADFRQREAKTRHLSYGSLGYVPHEQLEGRESAQGDVYSSGVILYEMLAGESFGQTPMTPARHDRRLGARLTTLREKLPDLQPAVVDLMAHMLSFRPEERPRAAEVEQRCADLAPSLERPDLRAWARSNVPAESALLPEGDDPMVGRLVREDSTEPIRFVTLSSTASAPAPVELQRPRRPQLWAWAPLVGAVMAVLATGAVLIALIGIWLGLSL
ncbi:MAG: serine/threonine-protein kinase [Myxococcota bacterium]